MFTLSERGGQLKRRHMYMHARLTHSVASIQAAFSVLPQWKRKADKAMLAHVRYVLHIHRECAHVADSTRVKSMVAERGIPDDGNYIGPISPQCLLDVGLTLA